MLLWFLVPSVAYELHESPSHLSMCEFHDPFLLGTAPMLKSEGTPGLPEMESLRPQVFSRRSSPNSPGISGASSGAAAEEWGLAADGRRESPALARHQPGDSQHHPLAAWSKIQRGVVGNEYLESSDP